MIGNTQSPAVNSLVQIAEDATSGHPFDTVCEGGYLSQQLVIDDYRSRHKH